MNIFYTPLRHKILSLLEGVTLMKLFKFLLFFIINYSFLNITSAIADSVRFMSYNVRHQTSSDTGNFAWQNRIASVISRIKANDPDVFGVQEATDTSGSNDIAGELISAFSADYGVVMPDNLSLATPKMIFYKKSKFQHLPIIGNSVRFTNINSSCTSPYANGRSLTGTRLKNISTNQFFIVVNTHFENQSDCGDFREESARELRTFINVNKGSNDSIVVLGDLNLDYSTILSSENTLEIIEHGDNSEPNTGTFDLSKGIFKSGSITEELSTLNSNWKGGNSTSYKKIDYIYYSYDKSVSNFLIDQTKNYFNTSPSDHYPVVIDLVDSLFEVDRINQQHAETDSNTQIFFAKINGDNCKDKITWNPQVNNGKTAVYLSNCNGTFQNPIWHNNGYSTVSTTKFYFADINGDGCSEKIFWRYNFNSGKPKIYTANCNGSFSSSSVSDPGGYSQVQSTQFFFAKIDNDQCYDKVFWRYNYNGGKPKIYLAKCDGTASFNPQSISDEGGYSQNADTKFYFADVTGDGCAEKIFWRSNFNDGKVKVYPSTCNGYFDDAIVNDGGSSIVSSTKYFFSDVTGDGCADKIFWRSNFGEGRVKVYKSLCGTNNSGDFADAVWSPSSHSESSSTNFYFDDVTGDGKADKIFWRYNYNGGKSKIHTATN
jgi:endonuclease/exonuclease/phosphatase family metal-dependent hydrolase